MKKTIHDPEEYTISVRKEVMDGMSLWVARVAELPDILEFGETRDDAYSNSVYTIKVGQEMCAEVGTPFPPPRVFEENTASGRITLRLKKSTHFKVIQTAEDEGVSLNSYISSLVESQLPLTGLKNIESRVSSLQLGIQRLSNAISKISSDNDRQTSIFTSLFNRTSVTLNSRMDLIGGNISYDDSESEFDAVNFGCLQGVSHVRL